MNYKDNRTVKYVYDFIDSKGNRHAGVNSYDNVLKWVTYVKDYIFLPEDKEKRAIRH